MSIPCPPAPSYVRRFGISDCEYLQYTPIQRQRLHDAYMDSVESHSLPKNGNGYFKIGGLDMTSNTLYGYGDCGCRSNPMHIYGYGDCGCRSNPLYGVARSNPLYGVARSNPVYGLGRSELSVSKAKNYNGGSKAVKPTSTGEYGSTKSEAFIKDLWTAQVLAYWVTDGNAFKEARDGGQVGLITQKGLNPSDPSPLNITSNGIAMTDLRSLLNPKGNRSSTFVLGPDAMFGPAAESIIEEWAGTRKLFGKSLSGKNTLALDRLAKNIKTPKIDAARAKRAAGQTVPSRTSAATTPCSQLSPKAQEARKDCVSPSGSKSSSGSSKTSGGSKSNTKVAGGDSKAEEEDNTLLYASIAGVSALVIGVGVVMYKKKKKARI